MKSIRIVFTILLFLTMVLNKKVEVMAVETGFSTESLSEEKKNKILANVNLTLLDSEPQKKAIECFDVNEDGMIAIGSAFSQDKTIAIYNEDGNYQYGYIFETSGSFGLEWDSNNNLIIYLVRSDLAIVVNPAGEAENVLKIQDTTDNNSYWHEFVFSTKRVVGEHEYNIKNDMGILNFFATSHSQLVVTNSEGETSIIYDVNSSQLIKSITISIGVLSVMCFVVVSLLKQYKEAKQKV